MISLRKTEQPILRTPTLLANLSTMSVLLHDSPSPGISRRTWQPRLQESALDFTRLQRNSWARWFYQKEISAFHHLRMHPGHFLLHYRMCLEDVFLHRTRGCFSKLLHIPAAKHKDVTLKRTIFTVSFLGREVVTPPEDHLDLINGDSKNRC